MFRSTLCFLMAGLLAAGAAASFPVFAQEDTEREQFEQRLERMKGLIAQVEAMAEERPALSELQHSLYDDFMRLYVECKRESRGREEELKRADKLLRELVLCGPASCIIGFLIKTTPRRVAIRIGLDLFGQRVDLEMAAYVFVDIGMIHLRDGRAVLVDEMLDERTRLKGVARDGSLMLEFDGVELRIPFQEWRRRFGRRTGQPEERAPQPDDAEEPPRDD